MYSENEKTELVDKMIEFLESHKVYELMELVADAVATKEQD